jgi:hypothetical protein
LLLVDQTDPEALNNAKFRAFSRRYLLPFVQDNNDLFDLNLSVARQQTKKHMQKSILIHYISLDQLCTV